eukprot:353578-Chlamydomonas_euryale.AAC.9
MAATTGMLPCRFRLDHEPCWHAVTPDLKARHDRKPPCCAATTRCGHVPWPRLSTVAESVDRVTSVASHAVRVLHVALRRHRRA